MNDTRHDRNPETDLTPSLVVDLRAGDGAASAMLEELYRTRLIRLCFGYLGNREEAEDVVQDVFCRVLENRRVPDNFRAWIYRICRNRCLDLLRSRRRKPEHQQLLTGLHFDGDLAGNLTHLVRGEQHSHLRQLVAALPEEQREVLRLRYTETLSRLEIAHVLDISESLVKSRIYEGLQKLRQHPSLLE